MEFLDDVSPPPSPDVSVIQLSAPSADFVARRATTLGTWVIAGSIDCILMGVVFSQVVHYFKIQSSKKSITKRSLIESTRTYLVVLVAFLSVLKTMQSIGIIWQQNVMAFADPDNARTLLSDAWWQVSTTLMTGIIGCTVQSFYAWRFFHLSRNLIMTLIIFVAMLIGLSGACLCTFYIIRADVKPKVMWLLVHLVFVCITDIMITTGTVYTLNRRHTGLERTASTIKRLLRLVFEAAIPPALFATTDLILTQTLGDKLLWHLITNYTLAKLYVISLLYTLNSISDYAPRRAEYTTDGKISFRRPRVTRTGYDVELDLESLSPATRLGFTQVHVESRTSTHTSPPSQSPLESQNALSLKLPTSPTESHFSLDKITTRQTLPPEVA